MAVKINDRGKTEINKYLPKASDERFFSFFQRREFGIPVALNCGESPAQGQDPAGLTEFVAVISIYLTYRARRIDFLRRLIKSDNDKREIDKIQSIEDLSHCLHPDDLAFLTDGKQDLLLCLVSAHATTGHKSIDDVFDMHETINKDFMVDHAELTFTPQALDLLVPSDGNSVSQNYVILCRVQLARSREMDDIHFIFERDFRENMNKFTSGQKYIYLLQTPGQTEYTLRIDAGGMTEANWEEVFNAFGVDKNVQHRVLSLIQTLIPDRGVVRRTVTVLSKKISGGDGGSP